MKRTKVNSTVVTSMGYDPATRFMELEFKDGAVWQYPNISPQRYRAFQNADSLGEYLASKIKPLYKDKK